MDAGIILVMGVGLGSIGTALLLWLLLLLDAQADLDASDASLSTLWRHLGARRDQQAQDNRTAAVVPPMVLEGKLSEEDNLRRAIEDVPGGAPAISPAGRFASSKSTVGVEGHAPSNGQGPKGTVLACPSAWSDGGRGQAPQGLIAPKLARPGIKPGTVLLLLAIMLSGCASVGGGVGDVHAGPGLRALGSSTGRASDASHLSSQSQPPTSPRTEGLPICGTEDPYLPDPCRIEITKGEWLKVSNPHPSKPTKHHSKLWWLLITLITF